MAWTYDADGNPLTVARTDDGQAAGSSQYAYDHDDNVTQITHLGPTGTTLASYSYTYDQGDRLSSETDDRRHKHELLLRRRRPTRVRRFADLFLRRQRQPGSGATIGTGNEITSDGTFSYTYDAAGNRITASDSSTGNVWTYGYDAQNQMISAVEKDSWGGLIAQASYVYDPFGNRVVESVTNSSGTTVTRFAYNAQAQTLWATLDGSGNLQTRYINGSAVDQVLAEIGADGRPHGS